MTGGRPGCWVYCETGCDTACQRAHAPSDMVGHRRDMTGGGGGGGNIRPSARYDTAPCMQPGRCGRTAWVQVVHPVHPT